MATHAMVASLGVAIARTPAARTARTARRAPSAAGGALATGPSRRLAPARGQGGAAQRRGRPLRVLEEDTPSAEGFAWGDDAPGEPFTLGLRRDASEVLELGPILGSGAMGVVRVATRYSDEKKFALKTLSKTTHADGTPAPDGWSTKVRDEVALHFALTASIDVVSVHDAFEDSKSVHLLLDLCEGGDLLTGAHEALQRSSSNIDALTTKELGEDEGTDEEDQLGAFTGFGDGDERWTPFSEAAAATAIRSVLRALAACHEHGLVHRDVKPANFIWMVGEKGERHLKLSDFGLATRIHTRGEKISGVCGTHAYLAPEQVKGMPYDFAVDSWAAGVVAYMLLVGEPPFRDREAHDEGRPATKEGLYRDIRRFPIKRHIEDIGHLSPGAKSLLIALLERDPERRMSCKEASEHYWVRENGVASHEDALAKEVVARLQAYGTLGLVRRASLRAAFEALDGEKPPVDVDDNMVKLVAAAAAQGCDADEECEVDWGEGAGGRGPVVPLRGLVTALEAHGAELSDVEWSALLRPIGGGINQEDLTAMMAAPGMSFDENDGGSNMNAFDWDAVARAAFARLAKHYKVAEKLPLEMIAEEVCRTDEASALCRAAVQDELSAADSDKDGALTLDEWISLIHSEGLSMDQSFVGPGPNKEEIEAQLMASRKAAAEESRRQARERVAARKAARMKRAKQ